MRIHFNQLYYTGKELDYIREAAERGKLSGDGYFTNRVQQLLEEKYGFRKCLLTTSCTDALEMAALLAGVGPGDEVIAPSYSFVSTVNPFVLRGAVIRFADSCADHPNIDVHQIEQLITPRTRVIVVMHYAGVACDMDPVMALARKHGLLVIEDAAQAIDAYYKGRPLGAIGDYGAFSFHETKNVIAGEAGMITVNHPEAIARAEIIREKGTNRKAFFRGQVKKYEWVDTGSSFLPSEIIAAILCAQVEAIDHIQQRRRKIWEYYHAALQPLGKSGKLLLPVIPGYAAHNGHMYYVLCESETQRDELIAHLDKKGIQALFHYQPLHSSPYYRAKHDGRPLPHCNRFATTLLRLPFYTGLGAEEQDAVIAAVNTFFK